MRSYQQIEAALERAANSIKEAECVVRNRQKEAQRLRHLLDKARLKETGVFIKIAKCERESGDGFMSTIFHMETTEGFKFGSARRYRVGGSYKILPSFYRQIKETQIRNDKRVEQGLTKCPACGSTKVFAIGDAVECMDCRKNLAIWNEKRQCWNTLGENLQ